MRDPVTYVTTHFPAVSHTFIATEIAMVERLGTPVVVVSINPARPTDLVDDESRAWQARTTYLKATPRGRVVRTFLGTVARHPSVLALPWRAGPLGAKALLWRYFQLVEAALVADVMRRHASRHAHAHFGQAPATIAWFAAEIGSRLAPRTEWTWSVTVHGWHEFANERAAALREKVAAARFVACVSDFTRAQLMRIADPADWSKLAVVRCGIDGSRFPRRASHPPGPVVRLVTVARLAPEKGQAVAVEALADLRRRGWCARLDLAGPDEAGFMDVVRAHAERLGVGEAVHFHGPATPAEVAALLEEADVFVLPTFAEGLPVVLMEAMARGVPVVTTPVAGIPELAVDERTALVVPPARADRLADAIERLLHDADLRERLVDAGAAAVSEQHDAEASGRRLAGLLDR